MCAQYLTFVVCALRRRDRPPISRRSLLQRYHHCVRDHALRSIPRRRRDHGRIFETRPFSRPHGSHHGIFSFGSHGDEPSLPIASQEIMVLGNIVNASAGWQETPPHKLFKTLLGGKNGHRSWHWHFPRGQRSLVATKDPMGKGYKCEEIPSIVSAAPHAA